MKKFAQYGAMEWKLHNVFMGVWQKLYIWTRVIVRLWKSRGAEAAP